MPTGNKDLREPEFWDCMDSEMLTHYDKDDAIEYYLDGFDKDNCPETFEVVGYVQIGINPALLHPLDRLLEHLDDEYGNPEGGYTDPTPRMIEAEKEFLKAVLDAYPVGQCEEVCRETINAQEWIRANRPDWLEEPKT